MRKKIVTGTTDSGFKFEVNREQLEEYEFFRLLCALDKGKITVLPDILEQLLGEEQEQKLLDHLREKNDCPAKTSDVVAEIKDIFSKVKEAKN